MNLLFLDLGRRTGFAYGPAGSRPFSGSVLLRKPGVANALALGALARWLRDHVKQHGKEDLWGVEHWMPPSAHKGFHPVEDALRMNGVIHAVAGVYGISVTEPYPATIRSQVCGKVHSKGADGESDTKAMVIRNMIMRGLIEPDCTDDNQADAVCGWVWMEANFGKVPSSNFVLMP